LKKYAGVNLKKIAVILFWAVVIVAAVVRISGQQIKINRYKSELAELNATKNELEESQVELATQTDLSASDEYIENVARTKLGYVRSDEVVFKKAD